MRKLVSFFKNGWEVIGIASFMSTLCHIMFPISFGETAIIFAGHFILLSIIVHGLSRFMNILGSERRK